MKINNIYYFLCILFMCIVLGVIFKNTDNLSSINCSSKLKIQSLTENTTAYANFNLTINKNNGWIKVKGDIQENGKTTSINRKVYFNYIRTKNIFNLNVNDIIIYRSDNASDETLEKILPYPYIYKNLNMDISIYPQGNNEYFVSSTEQHGVYCRP